MPKIPNPRDSQFKPATNQTGLSLLDSMGWRLGVQGGTRQQSRMINDKNWSLQHAIKYSYQGASIRKIDSDEIVPALINPDKVKQNYDDKILSTGYEFGFRPGDVFEWIETGTLWLVTLQELTELAYFRSEIRRCNYTISWDDGNGQIITTNAVIRGPIETQINFIQKHQKSVDIPNYSLSILVPKTKETLEHFRRYTKFFIGGLDEGDESLCWRVEVKDSLSMPGVLELLAEEYYINEYTDDVPNSLAGGLILKPLTREADHESMIEGPDSITVKTTVEYTYHGREALEWSWDKKLPIKAKIDGRKIKLAWTEMYSGSFILKCGEVEKEIKVKSLF